MRGHARFQVRLREVVEELLGPLRWSATTHQVASGAGAQRGWQPCILGLDKRQLLRQDVLKEMSRNRSNQRLVQEVRVLCAFSAGSIFLWISFRSVD